MIIGMQNIIVIPVNWDAYAVALPTSRSHIACRVSMGTRTQTQKLSAPSRNAFLTASHPPSSRSHIPTIHHLSSRSHLALYHHLPPSHLLSYRLLSPLTIPAPPTSHVLLSSAFPSSHHPHTFSLILTTPDKNKWVAACLFYFHVRYKPGF